MRQIVWKRFPLEILLRVIIQRDGLEVCETQDFRDFLSFMVGNPVSTGDMDEVVRICGNELIRQFPGLISRNMRKQWEKLDYSLMYVSEKHIREKIIRNWVTRIKRILGETRIVAPFEAITSTYQE